jgi:hypothetical protein
MKTKYCCGCHQTKEIVEFVKNKYRYDGLQSMCKNCFKTYHKNRNHPHIKKRKNKLSTIIKEYLQNHGCYKCGNRNDKLLKFRNKISNKLTGVKSLAHNGLSLKTIESKMCECYVVCMSCNKAKVKQLRQCHVEQYGDSRKQQLGMPHGTAMNRLKRLILFNLCQKLNLNYCYRCGKEINASRDLTIDHKINWLNNDVTLFWDLENIAFSHALCNNRYQRKIHPRKIIHGTTHGYKRGCRCDLCRGACACEKRKYRAGFRVPPKKLKTITERKRPESDQLGMSTGKARHKLLKIIIYDLMKKLEYDICYRCKKPITNINDLSIEHKIGWLNNDRRLFWDLENITFSHFKCNCGATKRTLVRPAGYDPATSRV